VVGLLWGISLFNYADRQAIFSVFPLLEKEFGLSPVQLGLLGSSFAWVYGLCSPLAGVIVDRVRRASAILGGLAIWSVICTATAVSRGFGALLAFRAAEGLGECFYFPASMSFLSGYHAPATRSRAMGMHQTSVYAGTILGGFFAGMIGERYGWRWSFVVFGGLGMLYALVLRPLLVEPPREVTQAPEPIKGLAAIWREPVARRLALAFLMANFEAVVLLSWMPKYLYDKFGLSLAMAGLTATLYVQLASLAGSAAGGWLADAWRQRRPGGRIALQGLALLGAAPFVALCGLTSSTRWLLVALTAWGLCKGLYDSNIFASVYDVVPAEVRGSAAGVMNAVGWVGGGSAPLAIGWLSQHWGLGSSIALSAAVYVAASVSLFSSVALLNSDPRK
jgi:predicted MFS family arabinose efflux permease